MCEMKCPICGGKLVYWGATGALLKCSQCHFGWGNEELWQELIRTRKALDVAVDALKSAHEYYQNCVIREKQPHEINWYCTAMNMDNDIFKALEQITALEQKD